MMILIIVMVPDLFKSGINDLKLHFKANVIKEDAHISLNFIIFHRILLPAAKTN